MLTLIKTKTENEQKPLYSVPVSSISDITEGAMFTSQRLLIGWFVATVVDFGYFPFILGQLEASQKKKEEEKRRFFPPQERYRFVVVVEKLMFCKWDIPIVLLVSFQNALIFVNKKAR